MAASLYAYRIEATHWPTGDGEPWARFYGPNAAAPHHEIPDWLTPLVEAAVPLVGRFCLRERIDLDRIADRIRYDDDRDELIGVLMPLPKRVNYLSASGVSELAADMRAFGADVTIHRSEPIKWAD
jgi:hypothetical protein